MPSSAVSCSLESSARLETERTFTVARARDLPKGPIGEITVAVAERIELGDLPSRVRWLISERRVEKHRTGHFGNADR